ncbi:hypothetical protein CDD83_9596 [Cordyceps sp. RAO-2017]|nr:hypothetical protein CDD83_9596 [Cordyceps sp. RAO-2017]
MMVKRTVLAVLAAVAVAAALPTDSFIPFADPTIGAAEDIFIPSGRQPPLVSKEDAALAARFRAAMADSARSARHIFQGKQDTGPDSPPPAPPPPLRPDGIAVTGWVPPGRAHARTT